MADLVITLLDLTKELIEALKYVYVDADPQSRETTGQRAQFDRAVAHHLDRLVALLLKNGFVRGKTRKQRRKVNGATWDRLGEAEKRVDVSRPALLRACLHLELLATDARRPGVPRDKSSG
jgi:hypothetical protein